MPKIKGKIGLKHQIIKVGNTPKGVFDDEEEIEVKQEEPTPTLDPPKPPPVVSAKKQPTRKAEIEESACVSAQQRMDYMKVELFDSAWSHDITDRCGNQIGILKKWHQSLVDAFEDDKLGHYKGLTEDLWNAFLAWKKWLGL